MKILLKNGNVFTHNGFIKSDIIINDTIAYLSNSILDFSSFDNVIDCTNLHITPGFVDVHVHFRQPGFSYKETIFTGSKSASRGGYVTVCTMPNLNPPPHDRESLKMQLEIIKEDSLVNIIPYGTITKQGDGRSSLSNMKDLSNFVIGFSDDGRGVQAKTLISEAMMLAKSLDKPIVAHCEDESLINGGYIHKGNYAKEHNHRGICSESEFLQIQRDVDLAKQLDARYHICHISTKESVAAIRKAKESGAKVTCETAPHYVLLCDEDLKENGKYKMNPPLRSKEDRDAIVQAIVDGTIDIIATDHAPHTREEKSKGLEGSAFGIVGLEIAFPLLYTNLVKKNIISLERLLELMCINPMKLFGLDRLIDIQDMLFKENMNFEKVDNILKNTGREEFEKINEDTNYYIHDNMKANFNILDLSKEYEIDCDEFLSKGRATPFEGQRVFAKTIKTIVKGNIVYEN